MIDLNGKRALVTGGTRGIGAAISVDLARSGADVAINGRIDDDQVRRTLSAIEAAGPHGHFVPGDCSRPDDIERAVAQAVANLGGLDILIHSAGGPAPGTIDEIPTDAWMDAFDVHVHGAFHLCRHVLPHLRNAGGGVIVLVASVAGLRGCPGAIAYGTVKGAVIQFTRMLARDVADENIRVNCVAPGIVRTRFHDAMTAEQKAHNLAQRIPLHREGTPEDVAEAVHMLITNGFMTGEVVVVDGGTTMQICR